MLDLVALWVVSTASLAGLLVAKQYRDSKRLIEKLSKGEIESFDREIDRLLARTTNPKMKAVLNINKSAGLLYLGRWSEGLEILRASPAQYQRVKQTRTVYVNNLLNALLLCKEYSEARRLFVQNERLLVPEGKNRSTNAAIMNTLAAYRYFFDEPNESRRLLERLLGSGRGPGPEAWTLYLLGRLDLHAGHSDLGWQRLEQSAALLPQSFFPQEVEDLRAGHPRIGPPGEGAASPYS